jgi:EAL domain-containing protein (putative c-di-GMP-specific phosphodiesterase class I)
VQQIEEVLQDAVFDPSHLKLEITESLLMENMESAMPSCHSSKRWAATFDGRFGTGYSSLSHLSQFPIDV